MGNQPTKAWKEKFGSTSSVRSTGPNNNLDSSNATLLDGDTQLLVIEDGLLEPQITYMLDTTINDKIWSFLLAADLLTWVKRYWYGVTDLFYIDHESLFFIATFDSKLAQDNVLRIKSWFCKGLGICTTAWSLNFKLNHSTCDFMPFWIELPTLPMEYRDLKIIELIANKIGVFI